MNTENYLPLAYLNAWEYCPRRFYLEYQLGEMEDNAPATRTVSALAMGVEGRFRQ